MIMLGTSTSIDGDLTRHESWFLIMITFLVNIKPYSCFPINCRQWEVTYGFTVTIQ